MILVVAETRHGQLNPASLEAVAAGQAIGEPLQVVVPGASVVEQASTLADVDADDVVALEHEALEVYTADGFVAALAAFAREREPAWIVLPPTYQTRDFAPALAARLGIPLVTDCTAVQAADTGLVLTRPMFRGKVSAKVAIDGPQPCAVTFQAGAFRAEAVRRQVPVSVSRVAAQVDRETIRQRPEAPFRERSEAVDLSRAERIVAVGRGIRGGDHLRLIEELAAALGAELGASRPVCDAGWLPMDRQVGSSGQTVSPRLYVAVGVSGAIQHLVGMRGAQTIVAINNDPDAPIFEVADYGVVGDLFEVVPAMLAALKAS